MEMVLKPLQDLFVIAIILFAFMGTGTMVIWFVTKDHMSRLDRVEIVTAVKSFIPDNAWYLGQLLARNKRVVILVAIAVANVALIAGAAVRASNGSWPLRWTVTGLVAFVVIEIVAALLFCVYQENKAQGWRRC